MEELNALVFAACHPKYGELIVEIILPLILKMSSHINKDLSKTYDFLVVKREKYRLVKAEIESYELRQFSFINC